MDIHRQLLMLKGMRDETAAEVDGLENDTVFYQKEVDGIHREVALIRKEIADWN